MAAGGPDDHGVAGRAAEQREGQRARIRVEPVELRGVAVELEDHRSEQGVVEEHPAVPEVAHVDAEDRAPLGEDGVRVGQLGLHRVLELPGELVGSHQADPQHQDEGDAGGGERRPAVAQAQPGEGQDHPGEEHGGHRSDGPDEGHHHGAGQARPQQVGEVEAADPLGPPEEDGDHHPDGEEGGEHRQADQDEAPELEDRGPGPVLPHLQGRHPGAGHDEVAEPDGGGGEQRPPAEDGVRRGPAQAARHGHEHAAAPDPEQGQSDDQVRPVVEELERDDPRVGDLQQQPGEADEQDLEAVAARAAGGRRPGRRRRLRFERLRQRAPPPAPQTRATGPGVG